MAKYPNANPHARFTQRKKFAVTYFRPQATSAAMAKHHRIAPLRNPAKKTAKSAGCGLPEIEEKTVVPSPVQKTMFMGFPSERNAPFVKSPRVDTAGETVSRIVS